MHGIRKSGSLTRKSESVLTGQTEWERVRGAPQIKHLSRIVRSRLGYTPSALSQSMGRIGRAHFEGRHCSFNEHDEVSDKLAPTEIRV